MAERRSSIELLRILSMLAIVATHFFWQTGDLAVHGGSFAVNWFCGFGTTALNVFVLIGCWFMVDSSFRLERPLRLYFETLGYTVPLTLVALAAGAEPSMKDVLRGFLPFTGRALWFVSAYIVLMALTPWLGRAFALSRRSLALLVALTTGFVCGVSTLPDAQNTFLCHTVWLVVLYLFTGFFKRDIWPVWRRWTLVRAAVVALAGLAVYTAIIAARVYGPAFGGIGKVASALAVHFLEDFKTLPIFFVSLTVFQFFLRLDLGSVRWINRLAKSGFAVYVIHQTPAFYPFLWSGVFAVESWLQSAWYPLFAVGTVVSVYLAAVLIDSVRAVLAAALLPSADRCAAAVRKLAQHLRRRLPKEVG